MMVIFAGVIGGVLLWNGLRHVTLDDIIGAIIGTN
jgi:hypothetical protein